MCLGKVAQVRAVRADGSVDVELDGRATALSDLLLDRAPVVGEWVLAHAGFALFVLTEDEARDALAGRGGSAS